MEKIKKIIRVKLSDEHDQLIAIYDNKGLTVEQSIGIVEVDKKVSFLNFNKKKVEK